MTERDARLDGAAALAKILFDAAGWTWWDTKPNPPTQAQIAETFERLSKDIEDGSRLETGRLLVVNRGEGQLSYYVKVG